MRMRMAVVQVRRVLMGVLQAFMRMNMGMLQRRVEPRVAVRMVPVEVVMRVLVGNRLMQVHMPMVL